MNHDQNLLQQIDACRPGSDDLHLPELNQLAQRLEIDPGDRRLYERVQQLDASLQAALDDVPVPDDLAARLLANLVVTPKKQASTRRRWTAGLVGLAVAAGLSGAVFYFNRPEPLTGTNLVQRAIEFYHAEQPGETSPIAQNAPLRFSQKVHQPPGVVWRKVVGFPDQHGVNAVAYELNFKSYTATLYVAKRQLPGLPAAPPSNPPHNTAGVAASAWQEGNMLYVLVVQGNSAAYQSFIKTPKLA